MLKRVVNSPLYSVPDAARYLNLVINLLRELIKYQLIQTLDLGQRKVPRQQWDAFIKEWTGKDIKGELAKRGAR